MIQDVASSEPRIVTFSGKKIGQLEKLACNCTRKVMVHKLTVMRYGSCHLTLQDVQKAHRADDLIGNGQQLGGRLPIHRMGMVEGPRVRRTFLLEHPVQNQYHSETKEKQYLASFALATQWNGFYKPKWVIKHIACQHGRCGASKAKWL